MKHVIILYVVMVFGAFSYCLSLLVAKDAPAHLVLAGGLTGLAILAGVSWLLWRSERELAKTYGQPAYSTLNIAISNEDAAGDGCGSNDLKK